MTGKYNHLGWHKLAEMAEKFEAERDAAVRERDESIVGVKMTMGALQEALAERDAAHKAIRQAAAVLGNETARLPDCIVRALEILQEADPGGEPVDLDEAWGRR